MSYRIVADSSVNLKMDNCEDFAVAAMKIITDEKEYVDNGSLNIEDMVTEMEQYKGKSGTACPSVGDWLEAFGDAEEVYCVTITSNLSGAYNSAMIAKQDYEEEYPERKVFVHDTLSTGPEMELAIEKIRELKKAGKSFEEICDEVKEYSKRTHLIFALKSLGNLAKNGRVSKSVAAIAGALNIRVVGKASDEGTLEQTDKVHGECKSASAIISRMKENGYKGGKVRISHCLNEKLALKLRKMLEDEFVSIDFKMISTTGLCSFYAERGGLIIGYEE